MDYKFLASTALFENMTQEEQKEAMEYLGGRTKKFLHGDVIYHAGDTISDMGLVLSGGVNIVVNYYWGGSSILGHIFPGQVFAESYAAAPETELLCDAVASGDTEVLFLNICRLLSAPMKCSCYNALMRNLLRISAKKNINMTVRMTHTASKRIRDRLLSYLSEQAMLNGINQFTIPFSRQQLADYLGVERSALSNELSKMKRDGLVDYEKNSFKLLCGQPQ